MGGNRSYLILIQVHFKLEAKFDNDAFLKWVNRLSTEFIGNLKNFWSVSPQGMVLLNIPGGIKLSETKTISGQYFLSISPEKNRNSKAL